MSKGQPMPAARKVASDLVAIKGTIEDCFQDEEGNIGIEVRLQVLPDKTPPFFSWRLWTGDSSYDTDHRGFWGNCFVQRDSNCLELAKSLIDQAAEHAAQ